MVTTEESECQITGLTDNIDEIEGIEPVDLEFLKSELEKYYGSETI